METIIDLTKFENVLEASHRLKVHPETIRRLIRQGDLAAAKLGNTWLIDKDKLESFAKTYQPKQGRKKRLN